MNMHFLNSEKGYSLFKGEAGYTTYVDKTLMVNAVYQYARKTKKHICVTRPRRFGKTTVANMIAAFFDKSTASKSKLLFEAMAIGKLKNRSEKQDPSLCWSKQGKLNVIRINMIDLIDDEIKSYRNFRYSLNRWLKEDLHEAYPSISLKNMKTPEILEKTGDEFIFVIDEWDAIFEARFMREEDKQDYLLFLKDLLNRDYVHFAYMTGILPIAMRTCDSPLNMFHEFSSFEDSQFYPYFGLTEQEITDLMQRQGFTKPSLSDLSSWYDGYVREDGIHVFNPMSVAKALGDKKCHSNWTTTGPMNEIKDIIQRNVQDIREDVIRMVGGETLHVKLGGFSIEKPEATTKDEILSAMVVYGFLSYSQGKLCIPNHELMLKFQQALASNAMGLRQTLDESTKLLEATLARDGKQVARLIEELHDDKIPFFQYSNENSLACVVTVGYLAALDKYKITREDKAGKGYVDFVFEPITKGDIPIILELKYNHSAKNALKCIHEKGYIKRFKNDKQVLLTGINYSSRTKKHTCLMELVEQ